MLYTQGAPTSQCLGQAELSESHAYISVLKQTSLIRERERETAADILTAGVRVAAGLRAEVRV